jgi:hypothetical protein
MATSHTRTLADLTLEKSCVSRIILIMENVKRDISTMNLPL